MPNTPPRPTSSRPRPKNRDDLPGATSSIVPHPYGDEVALRRPRTTTETTHPARPRDEVTGRGNEDTDVRRCRECGCTDFNACEDFLDQPCWWVSANLCSSCVGQP